jgi:hypothetical protein
MKQLEFSIQNLLSENKEGAITGPMLPTLFAKEMAQQIGFKYNRIARVWFQDNEIHQIHEGDGLTGHDTLIIGCQYRNDLWLSLWVDVGIGGTAVAMACKSDREVIIAPVYEKATFARKLTRDEMQEIFAFIFENPGQLTINQFKK